MTDDDSDIRVVRLPWSVVVFGFIITTLALDFRLQTIVMIIMIHVLSNTELTIMFMLTTQCNSRLRTTISLVSRVVSQLKSEAVRDVISELESNGVTLGKELMFPLIRSSGSTVDRAHCSNHDRVCDFGRADLHVAGFPCIAWSPQGQRGKDQSKDFKFWSAWVAHRRRMRELWHT